MTVKKALALLALLGVLLLLFAPEPARFAPAGAGRTPFAWNRDARWQRLTTRFAQARAAGCDIAASGIGASLASLEPRIAHAASLAELEAAQDAFFDAAAIVAACPSSLDELSRIGGALRDRAKALSASGSFDRDALYRVVYGSRLAVEEALLQAPDASATDRVAGPAPSNAHPSAVIEGVRVQSGDILVSRGGAPTSALIARGNDYPGNFSHVAMLHVDEVTREVSVIESHIERGVVVGSVDDYLRDKKLRILVLRAKDPRVAAVAHKAALTALEAGLGPHVAYDFAMDFTEPSRQFCSEVVYAAYARHDAELWPTRSTMSSRGVVPWLAALGVRNFVTLAPADLEYDPQLEVVVEWRNLDALYDDHLDNAVVDAMLAEAERGAEVPYARAWLPLARVAKLYSVALNVLRMVGPVPEGMSATVALRAQWLADEHARRKRLLRSAATAFEREHGMRPPYWELARLAERAR